MSRSRNIAVGPVLLFFMLVALLLMTACSKPETTKTANKSATNSDQAKLPSGNESSSKSNQSSSAKFHVTGVLLNKDRSPALDKSVVLEEISGEGGTRKSELKFAVIDGTMQLANPHARTDAKGQFDIEVDPALAEEKKEFGLIVLDLSLPAKGPRTSPPFLSVGGKRVTFKLGGPPTEIRLGEIVIK